SHGTPASAIESGDTGAPTGYHSLGAWTGGEGINSCAPLVAAPGRPNTAVSPWSTTSGAAATAARTAGSLTGARLPSSRHAPGATRRYARVGSWDVPRRT